MDQLKELQRLALVNKITTGEPISKNMRTRFKTPYSQLYYEAVRLTPFLNAELENHLGIAEKTLAEFIVELAQSSSSQKLFRQVC